MSDDIVVGKDLIGQLIDGTIDDSNATRLLRMAHKDKDRFFKYIEALQDRVSWKEPILLRLGDKLYIVRGNETARTVKCQCGHEFGDYRENWKLKCKIRTRKTQEEMNEVYDPLPAVPEAGWQEIREFFCPACATQHAVEVVAPGYPIVFEMLPDLDKFYREYMGKPLDDENENWYVDHSHELTKKWAEAK